jgi:hypothetical protein
MYLLSLPMIVFGLCNFLSMYTSSWVLSASRKTLLWLSIPYLTLTSLPSSGLGNWQIRTLECCCYCGLLAHHGVQSGRSGVAMWLAKSGLGKVELGALSANTLTLVLDNLTQQLPGNTSVFPVGMWECMRDLLMEGTHAVGKAPTRAGDNDKENQCASFSNEPMKT